MLNIAKLEQNKALDIKDLLPIALIPGSSRPLVLTTGATRAIADPASRHQVSGCLVCQGDPSDPPAILGK